MAEQAIQKNRDAASRPFERLSVRFSFFYMLMAGLSLLFLLTIYNLISARQERSRSLEVLGQSTEMVASSMDSMIDIVKNNSITIIGDEEIQKILRDPFVSTMKADELIKSTIGNWAVSLPFINSVYLFRIGGGTYGINKLYNRSARLSDIVEADWYQEVAAKKGYYQVTADADYFLTYISDGRSVSFLRLINDLQTFRPLGVLMVNIPESALRDTFRSLSGNMDMLFCILDEEGNYVTGSVTEDMIPEDVAEALAEDRGSGSARAASLNGYLLDTTPINSCSWTVAAYMPSDGSRLSTRNLSAYFGALVAVMILLFAASFLLMQMEVVKPIRAMAKTMASPGGKLHKMTMGVPRGELTVMKDTFNDMVDRNEDLIRQINEEQRIKRKAELRVLQEQIRPHFLYNTLNAMQYLCAMKETDELYDALESLGRFYRLTLSKGREIVTVREETELVEQYIRLQKLRYGDGVSYEIHVPEELYEIRMPKLILQPLVENSLHHGMRPRNEIHIEVFVNETEDHEGLLLTVRDNGIGMNEEQLAQLREGSLQKNEKSFGLRGTVARLHAMYENDMEYTIESTPEAGTTVRIRIPTEGRGDEEL